MRSHQLQVTPSPAGECVPPPPRTKGGGTHSPAVEGVGSPNSDDRKSLALCLLWILLCSTQCTPQLPTITWCGHINSVKSLYVVTPTLYHECTQLVQKILWLNWIEVTWRSQQTAYIHSMELEWLCTFMVWSWCDHVKHLYGVQKSKYRDFDQ